MLNLQDRPRSTSPSRSTSLPSRPSLDAPPLRQRLTPTEARQWSVAPEHQHPVLPRLQRPAVQSVAAPSHFPWMPRWAWFGGWMMALGAIALSLIGGHSLQANTVAQREAFCETMVSPNTVLSRSQLAQLLTLPERSQLPQVRELVPQPYCQLADLEVRAEVMAQREAYPLAFDPQTWLILLFEGDEYAGYAFSFQS